MLHVITSLDIGGAEGVLTRLLHEGARQGQSQYVVSMLPGGAWRDVIRDMGVQLWDLDMRRGWPDLRAVLTLTRLMRELRPEVVQSWMYHADLVSTIALGLSGQRRRTVLVWGVRASNLDFSRYRRLTSLVARGLACLSGIPDAVLCNSGAGRSFHAGLGYRPQRWAVCRNGIDSGRFRVGDRCEAKRRLGLAPDDFVVGLSARVDPMKDHANFVDAARIFRRRVPSARFVLAGAGTERGDGELGRLLRASGIGDAFLPLGVRSDMECIIPAFDVATLSSAFGEGFPNVLGEAMACGVPCVSTDCGDAAQLLGETGLIVPCRDPVALADGWAQLRDMGEAGRTALGTAARARVKAHYSMAQMKTCMDNLYDGLAAQRAAAGDG